MNKENLVTFDFVTEDGEELRISGKLTRGSYDTFFEFYSAINSAGDDFDEEDLLEEDLERLVEEAEDYLEETELYR
jgi:hypothetical protein